MCDENNIGLNMYIGLHYAGYIKRSLVLDKSLNYNNIIKFIECFDHVYNTIKKSVPININLSNCIIKWLSIAKKQSNNTKFLSMGTDLYINLIKTKLNSKEGD